MTDRSSASLLVIGYGSRLHGDDAVGPLVAERLQERLRHPLLRCLECHQLLPELAELIAAADRVLFVDASLEQPGGQIGCRALRYSPNASLLEMGHAVNPLGLLSLAERTYGRAPAARLYTIGAQRLDLGAPLSRAAATAVERLVAHLARRLPHRLGTAGWNPRRRAGKRRSEGFPRT